MLRYQPLQLWRCIVWLTIAPVALAACIQRRPAAPVGVVVPFDLVREVPIVRGSMNGAGPYNFILDTGANPSAVDLGAARAAGVFVDESRAGEAAGAGSGRVPIFAARIDQLKVGDYAIDSLDAVAVDLSAIAQRLGLPLHGVLGYSFLAGRVVQIDYPRRTISFLEPGYRGPRASAASSDRQVTLRFEFPEDETIPLLATFQVNGHALPVTLDTGSSLTLEVSPADAAAVGLRQSAAAEDSTTAVGARGDVTLTSVMADSIGIGSLRVKDVVVYVSPRLSEASYRHGNLGNGFLKHFVLTLDYSLKELTLQMPRADR